VAKFVKGESGNPAGGKKGQPRKLTIAARRLVEQYAPQLVKQVLTEAVAEDDSIKRREARTLAFKFLLPRFSRFIAEPFAFTPPVTIAETRAKLGELAQAFTEGKIDVDAFSALVQAVRVFDEAGRAELMERLGEIESVLSDSGGGHPSTGSEATSGA
jgi:hypothetical protein